MPTIYESFRQAVDPDHVGSGRRIFGGSDGNVHVSAPSNTTRTYEPPNFLLKTPESKWLSIADSALDRNKARLNEKNTRLAPWESNMRMDSEGDVVYGSAIYLNNPVHTALHAAQNHSKSCDIRSEVTFGATSRADMGYFRNGRAYAILEYKKLGAISKRCARGDFERGVPKDPKMFAQWMSSAEQKFMRDVRGAEDTRSLLQQAVHYQSKFGTRFVALFDWNSLVLLVLPPCRGVGLNDSVSYAYITEVTDNRKFRRALLGFLLFAYKNSTPGPAGDLRQIQPDVLPSYAQAYHRRVAEEAKRNRPRKQDPQGLGSITSYLQIQPQGRPFDGTQYSNGRGRVGNQRPTAVPNRYNTTNIPSENRCQNSQNEHRYPTNIGGYSILDGQITRRAPYTTASSTYSEADNSTVIHTYITLPGRNENKSPGRRIRKQPSQSSASQHGCSGGLAIHTRNNDRGTGRPHQMPHIAIVGDGAGLFSAPGHRHGDENYAKNFPEHFGTYKGNDYLNSDHTKVVHKDKLASGGNHTKDKNGGKFLGIFKTR